MISHIIYNIIYSFVNLVKGFKFSKSCAWRRFSSLISTISQFLQYITAFCEVRNYIRWSNVDRISLGARESLNTHTYYYILYLYTYYTHRGICSWKILDRRPPRLIPVYKCIMYVICIANYAAHDYYTVKTLFACSWY